MRVQGSHSHGACVKRAPTEQHLPLLAGPSGCVGLKTTPAPPGCICTYLGIRRGGKTPNRHVDTKPNLHY